MDTYRLEISDSKKYLEAGMRKNRENADNVADLQKYRKQNPERVAELTEASGEEEKVIRGKVEKLHVELHPAIRIGIKLVLLMALVIAGVVFLNKRCLIKTINVETVNPDGISWYTDEEIIKALQTSKYDDYSLFMKAHYVLYDFPNMPFIQQMNLTMDDLQTMTIKVYQKNIVGCIRIMSDYLYFDKDGIVVASHVGKEDSIPQIVGLDFSKASINKALAVPDSTVFNAILELTQQIKQQKLDIDSIEFDKSLNITLNCKDGNIAYIGKNKNYDEIIKALPEILKSAERKAATYRLDMSQFSRSNTDIPATFIKNLGESIESGEIVPDEETAQS